MKSLIETRQKNHPDSSTPMILRKSSASQFNVTASKPIPLAKRVNNYFQANFLSRFEKLEKEMNKDKKFLTFQTKETPIVTKFYEDLIQELSGESGPKTDRATVSSKQAKQISTLKKETKKINTETNTDTPQPVMRKMMSLNSPFLHKPRESIMQKSMMEEDLNDLIESGSQKFNSGSNGSFYMSHKGSSDLSSSNLSFNKKLDTNRSKAHTLNSKPEDAAKPALTPRLTRASTFKEPFPKNIKEPFAKNMSSKPSLPTKSSKKKLNSTAVDLSNFGTNKKKVEKIVSESPLVPSFYKRQSLRINDKSLANVSPLKTDRSQKSFSKKGEVNIEEFQIEPTEIRPVSISSPSISNKLAQSTFIKQLCIEEMETEKKEKEKESLNSLEAKSESITSNADENKTKKKVTFQDPYISPKKESMESKAEKPSQFLSEKIEAECEVEQSKVPFSEPELMKDNEVFKKKANRREVSIDFAGFMSQSFEHPVMDINLEKNSSECSNERIKMRIQKKHVTKETRLVLEDLLKTVEKEVEKQKEQEKQRMEKEEEEKRELQKQLEKKIKTQARQFLKEKMEKIVKHIMPSDSRLPQMFMNAGVNESLLLLQSCEKHIEKNYEQIEQAIVDITSSFIQLKNEDLAEVEKLYPFSISTLCVLSFKNLNSAEFQKIIVHDKLNAGMMNLLRVFHFLHFEEDTFVDLSKVSQKLFLVEIVDFFKSNLQEMDTNLRERFHRKLTFEQVIYLEDFLNENNGLFNVISDPNMTMFMHSISFYTFEVLFSYGLRAYVKFMEKPKDQMTNQRNSAYQLAFLQNKLAKLKKDKAEFYSLQKQFYLK